MSCFLCFFFVAMLGATVAPPPEAVPTYMPKPVHVVRVKSPSPSVRSASSTVVSYYYEGSDREEASGQSGGQERGHEHGEEEE